MWRLALARSAGRRQRLKISQDVFKDIGRHDGGLPLILAGSEDGIPVCDFVSELPAGATVHSKSGRLVHEAHPSPGRFAATLSLQARLGELASYCGQIRKRIWQGRGYLPAQRARPAPSPHPHPLADADIWSCKLAKASLPGEGWGEGAFAEALSRIWCHSKAAPSFPARPPATITATFSAAPALHGRPCRPLPQARVSLIL